MKLNFANSTLFETEIVENQNNSSFIHANFVTIKKYEVALDVSHSNTIHYQMATTNLGNIFIASTDMGICTLFFDNQPSKGLEYLQKTFPNDKIINKHDDFQQVALQFLNDTTSHKNPILLHVHATDFQILVWKSLLHIPVGNTISYQNLALTIGKNAKASRAIGSAVAKNPVAYIIPCHRVINQTGKLSNYRWGKKKKLALLNREMDF